MKYNRRAMNTDQKISDIKVSNFSSPLTKGCLVLEGGAFRGVYTAGVLDYFIEHGLRLDTCYGVSAGALTGSNYLAGDFGRSALLILEHRKNNHYVGINAIKESGSVIGFKFMFEEMEKEYPLNEKELLSDNKTLYISATNVYSGECEYFTNHEGKEKLFKALRASASLPLISKMVKIDNKLYLDGGCTIKIPIRKALEDGNEKIVFIGTRDASYRRKTNSKEIALIKKVYHKYKKFIESFSKANKVYNEDCDYIDRLVEEGRIFRITPSKKVKISRLEKSIKKLSDLYYMGYYDARDSFDSLLQYLNN